MKVKLVTSHAEDEGQLQELTAVYEFLGGFRVWGLGLRVSGLGFRV